MIITSSVIYHFLSRHCNSVQYSNNSRDTAVKGARIFSEDYNVENEYIYIIEADELRFVEKTAHCAFIFYNSTGVKLPARFAEMDVIFVQTELKKSRLANIINDTVTELNEWDCALKDQIIDGSDLLEVLITGKKILKSDIWMIDSNYEYVTSTDAGRLKNPQMSFDSVTELLLQEEFSDADTYEGAFLYPNGPKNRLCFNVFYNGRYRVRIITIPSDPESSLGEMYLFEHLCKYISMVYIQRINPARDRRHNEDLYKVIRDILIGNPEVNPNNVRAVLESHNWNPSNELVLIVITIENKKNFELTAPYLCRQLEADWQYSCALEIDDRLVWIVNKTLSSPQEREMRTSQYLARKIRDLMGKAGESDVFSGFENLKQSYTQAVLSLVYGQRNSLHLWYFSFNDYVLDYMIDNMKGVFPSEMMLHKGIKKLMQYDEENNTDYTKTLFFYIKSNYNTTAAMERSFVHRTTFLRRLERIREIGGIDLDDPDEMLYIALSYKMLDKRIIDTL